eukprot:4037177-Amphidinium_carterae.1
MARRNSQTTRSSSLNSAGADSLGGGGGTTDDAGTSMLGVSRSSGTSMVLLAMSSMLGKPLSNATAPDVVEVLARFLRGESCKGMARLVMTLMAGGTPSVPTPCKSNNSLHAGPCAMPS